MLKSRNTVYLLIATNFLIWGYFIYTFFSLDASPVSYPGPLQKGEVHAAMIDTVAPKLLLDYQDPFLKDEPRIFRPSRSDNGSVVGDAKTKDGSKVKKPAITPTVAPVDMRYVGLVRNRNNGAATALVVINGQSRLIRQNEVVDGIIFRTFSRDSLVANRGKERIVARK